MNFWVIAIGLLILIGFSIPGNYVHSVRHSPQNFVVMSPNFEREVS